MKTKYLRMFPGKTRYQSVSKDAWEEPLPLTDVGGWGHVARLEADVRVWAPDGELQIARKWVARSYIRNFARIMRLMFGTSLLDLVDIAAVARGTSMDNTEPYGLIGSVNQVVGGSGNTELSGAGMAIGDGVAVENHLRNDLVSRVGGIYSARNNVRTSVFTTATTTLEITTGITNAQASSVNITEIALFLFAVEDNDQVTSVPFRTLLAYDGIASTPVAVGGVIAPRYTLDFPA